MKFFLPILCWLSPFITNTQAKDSLQQPTDKTINTKPTQKKDTVKIPLPQAQGVNTASAKASAVKPEIFTSGFIDIINNGQVNASARFIRLYIGEPGKFAIPLSIYSGVSSNNFQNQQNPVINRSNEQLVTNFINPLSGLANLSVDGVLFFKKNEKITKTGLLYHFGERILTGFRAGPANTPSTGKPVNFLNSFGAIGFYFQTGAWERSNAKNIGVFWMATRYIACKTGSGQLKEILPDIRTNGFYHGWSLAWGVEINNLVNIKVIYYKYVKKPEVEYSLPIYQFSFNYSLKK